MPAPAEAERRSVHAPAEAPRRPIRVLERTVVELIAAGEVVERPASVARELVDNALDAGATDITVDLLGGGLELIRVADNGSGIPAQEAPLALARHATSKIASIDDLQRLDTLGFRGEALGSIAAVAELSLTTRTRQASMGTLLISGPDSQLRQEPAARQPGTTVSVRHLFAQVPARRKFLDSARAESNRVLRTIRQLALSHPGVRISLVIDGRVAFASRGLGDVRAVLADVYGPAVAASMRTFADAAIDGYISPPSLARPDRQQITLVINGRPTSAPGLLSALEAAYRPVLPRGRHPIALIFVSQPPAEVDPNVHPAKAQVRLRQELALGERLGALVRETLARSPNTPAADEDFSLGPDQLGLPRPRGGLPGLPVRPFGGEPADHSLSEALLAPRSLQQIQHTLVLVESDIGLLLVDQHRAHERIIYERLRAAQAPSSQVLLEPVVLELKPHQAAQLLERLDALQALGFDCQHFGGHDFLVRSVPAVAGGEELREAIPSLLIEAAGPDDRWQARLLVGVACRAAIRRGRELLAAEQRQLLEELAGTSAPAACPHGSPLILHFSGAFLRRQFRW